MSFLFCESALKNVKYLQHRCSALIISRTSTNRQLVLLQISLKVIQIEKRSHLIMWWVSSCSESFRLLGWKAENTASGQGLPRERSRVGSWFSDSFFLDDPGTATEQVRTCGIRRNSSSLDKAPKTHDSVRVNSLGSFLMTLPSISSETWEIYSWAIPGSSVFCDWLFFVFSGIFVETAANCLLFLNVAMILREKLRQLRRLNWLL